MKKIVAIFCVLLVFFGANSVLGQRAGAPQNLGSLITPSSSASSQTKTLDVPVNLYTGKPQIGIPLYILPGHQLSLPISLSYDAGGIRNDEKASWVGLGWSLSAGGVVTRSVKGMPDESTSGFLGPGRVKVKRFLGLPGVAPMTSIERRAFLDAITRELPLAEDSEPDIFWVNTPWWSGKFTFNLDGQIMTVPHNSVHISHDPSLNTFELTTPKGIKLTFGDTCRGTSSSASMTVVPLNMTTSWHLLKAEDLLTKDTIVFRYKAHSVSGVMSGTSQTLSIPLDHTSSPPHIEGRNLQSHNTWILSQIHSSQGSAHFYSHPPALLRKNAIPDGLLDSIKITDKANQLIKQFDFQYSGQLSLRRLTEKLADCAMPSYEFFYHTTNFGYYNQDHWGFSNSNTLPRLIPSFHYYDAGRLKLYIGVDRDTDPVQVKSGSLYKIKYPTGGITEFEMEAHQYYQKRELRKECFASYGPYDGDIGKAPNLLTAFCEVKPLLPPGTGFTSCYPDSSNFTFVPHTLPVGDTTPVQYLIRVKLQSAAPLDSTASYASVNITKRLILSGGLLGSPIPDDSWICAFSGASDSTCAMDTVFCKPLDPAYEYHFKADVSPSHPGFARVSLETKRPMLGDTYYAGGLRIKRMMHHDGVSPNPQITRYEYTYFDSLVDAYHCSGDLYGKYEYNFRTTRDGTQYENSSSHSILPLNTTQGSHVGYSHVTVYQGENGENGKTEHTFTCMKPELGGFVDSTYNTYPFAAYSNNDNKRGRLLQQITYKNELGVFSKVQETHHVYELHSASPINITRGIKAGVIVEPCVLEAHYSVQTYSIIADWYYRRRTVERIYDQNDETKFAEQSMQYTYNNLLHQEATQIRSSTSEPGSFLITETRYNSDFVGPTTTGTPSPATSLGAQMARALYWLRGQKIWAAPVEVISYETKPTSSISLISASLNLYRLDFLRAAMIPSLVLDRNYDFELATSGTDPAVARCNLAGPVGARLFNIRLGYKLDTEFLAYNREANITHFRKANHYSQSLIWGYENRYPIAKVENARPNQVFHTSFEDATGSLHAEAKTGEKLKADSVVLALSGSTGLPAGQYVLSYWAKGASSFNLTGTSSLSGSSSGADWHLVERELSTSTTGPLSLRLVASLLDEVRLVPKHGLMSTFTHRPLVGMSSTTSPNHLTQYFEYDKLLRMKLVRDHKRNILKMNTYKVGIAPICD